MLGRFVGLPHYQDDHWWYISRLSGCLIKSSEPPPFQSRLLKSSKLQNALKYCDNPFDCNWSSTPTLPKLLDSDYRKLLSYNSFLFSLGNRFFLLSLMYASKKSPIFENSKEAFSSIARMPGHLNEPSDRCFQRSLLVAKTSKSFFNSGVLFIGAEFNTGEMHAWIIEDGEQPDPDDRSWINYRPLLAFF
jgi:hypothetical protein